MKKNCQILCLIGRITQSFWISKRVCASTTVKQGKPMYPSRYAKEDIDNWDHWIPFHENIPQTIKRVSHFSLPQKFSFFTQTKPQYQLSRTPRWAQ